MAYVTVIESLLNDGFTNHQRNEDNTYGRRTFEALVLRDVHVPTHLYAQLSTSKEGLELLDTDEGLKASFALLRQSKNSNCVESTVAVKAAIWACCSLAISVDGLTMITNEKVVESVAAIVENSMHLGLRATAMYALSLIAVTRQGVKLLNSVNWCALKYSRSEKWPVLEEWFINQLAALHLLDASLKMDQERPEAEEEADPSFDVQVMSTPRLERSATPNDSLVSTSSGGKGSVSRRSRLSKMFRSFSLNKDSPGSETSPDSKGSAEKSKNRMSARIKRKLFTHSNTTGDKDDVKDEVADDFKYQQPGAESTASEAEASTSDSAVPADEQPATGVRLKDAPIATPENLSNANVEIVSNGQDFNNSSDTEGLNNSPGKQSVRNVNSDTPSTKEDMLKQRQRSITRSGQRAHSESEAQNLSTVSKHTTPTLAQPIPVCETNNLNQRSIASISSAGSWSTENPNYYTMRSIHERRRPKFLEHDQSNSGNESDAISPGNASTLQRSDNWSKKSKSLDYKVLRNPGPRFGTLPLGSEFIAKQKTMLPLLEEGVISGTDGTEPRFWGLALPRVLETIYPCQSLSPQKEPPPPPSINEGETTTSSGRTSTIGDENHHMVDDWLETHHPMSRQGNNPGEASFHGLDLHTPATCLGCFKLTPVDARPRAESLSIPESGGNLPGSAPVRAAMSQQGSPQMRRMKRQQGEGDLGGLAIGKVFIVLLMRTY